MKVCSNEHSGNVIFNCNGMGVLNNTNLDNNFLSCSYQNWLGILNLKKGKNFKKYKRRI